MKRLNKWIPGFCLLASIFILTGPASALFADDGESDTAVWRPSDGNWYIFDSQTGTITVVSGGMETGFPVPHVPGPVGNEGEGLAGLAVWRPADGNWYIFCFSEGTLSLRQWNTTGDLSSCQK